MQSESHLQVINLTGSLEAKSSVQVSCPQISNGNHLTLIRVVAEGTLVAEGDLLMEFDGCDLGRRLRDTAIEFQRQQEEDRTKSDAQAARTNEQNYKKRMRDLLDAIDSLTIRAPAAGVVVYRRDISGQPIPLAGNDIEPKEPLLEVRDLSSMRVRALGNANDAGTLRVGLKSLITVPALQGATFAGRVIELRTNITQRTHQSAQKTAEVCLELDPDQDLSLLQPGMSSSVEIQVGTIPDTVVLQKRPAKKSGPARLILRPAGIFIIVLAVIAAAVYRNRIMTQVSRVFVADEEEPVPVLTLERNPLQLEIQANGEIVGLQTVPVATPATRSGSLKLAWLIPEGTIVEAGQPVFRFDATNTQLNLELQNNTLTQNRENTKITTGNQQLNERTISIDRSQAQMDYEYSMTVLPQDESIFSKWDIIEAQINAGFAKSRIDNLSSKAKVQKRIARSQQQVLTIDRNRAQTEVDIIKQTLAAMELRAPTGGLLLYRRERRRDPQIGDNFHAGQVVVDIVNLNALQARIYVLEKEAGSLARDKPVTMQLDALPDKEFHGEVGSVSSVAAALERNSPLKYFTCEVTISDAGDYLRHIKPGMALRARVILEKYDSCFVVPAGAITPKGNDMVVYIKQGDAFVPRTVQVGIGKHGQATILSGVEEKELIALRNPFETRKLSLPDFSKGYLRRKKAP